MEKNEEHNSPVITESTVEELDSVFEEMIESGAEYIKYPKEDY